MRVKGTTFAATAVLILISAGIAEAAAKKKAPSSNVDLTQTKGRDKYLEAHSDKELKEHPQFKKKMFKDNKDRLLALIEPVKTDKNPPKVIDLKDIGKK
jgi:hypothetical protein